MKQENINNLISLWKTAGQGLNSYYENPQFNYSIVRNSEWPNRIWINDALDYETLKSISKFVAGRNENLTIPYWDMENSNSDELFNEFGFKVKFNQIGMSMKLENKFIFNERLSIKRIMYEEDAQIWEDIYPLSFGYKISKEILLATKDKIQYYLAFLNNEPIGTAIIYNTNNIAGIHGVGVIPTARRMGYAEEIMKSLLNNLIDLGAEYSTLQASDMGKGIYLKLGYKEDFSISNYILSNPL